MGAMEWLLAIFGILGGGVSIFQIRVWHSTWMESRIDTFASIERYSRKLRDQVNRADFSPTFILGLGRSGAFIGGWLASNLAAEPTPIEVIDRLHPDDISGVMTFPHVEQRLRLLEEVYGPGPSVLVIMGASMRGDTFRNFEQLRHASAPNWTCKYAVLYELDTTGYPSTFVARHVKTAPARFPWQREGYKSGIRKQLGRL